MVDVQTLLEQAKAGNEQAFSDLYEAVFPDIRRFVYYKVGDKHDTQDIVSDTFLHLFKSLGSYSPAKGSAKTRLYTIAYRLVVDFFRRNRASVPYQRLEERAGEVDEKTMLDAMDSSVEAGRILQFLDGLKPQHKEIVLMRIREEMSYEEIAQVMGMSIDACKQVYYRTVKQMTERLGTLLVLLFVCGITL